MPWNDNPLESITIPGSAGDAEPRVYVGQDDPMILALGQDAGIVYYFGDFRAFMMSVEQSGDETYGQFHWSARSANQFYQIMDLDWDMDNNRLDISFAQGQNLIDRKTTIRFFAPTEFDDPVIFDELVTVDADLDVNGTLTADIWGVNYIAKSAGQNFTNTTVLANVTDMSFTAVANAVYRIECRYAIGGPIAGDVRLAWTVPAGASMDRNIITAGATLAGSNEAATIAILRRGAATQQQGGTSANTAPGNDFTGWWEDTILTVGANGGTVQLQGAQGTANATPTVFQIDSFMIVTRIA